MSLPCTWDDIVSLAALAPDARDAALDTMLGLDGGAPSADSPGPHLIGYHASGLAPVCRAVLEVPITRDDVVIDLGAGRGRVLAVVQALTGARVRGIELQRELIASAVRGVALEHGDVRSAPLEDGTVFYLYTPFTGPVMDEVVARLRAVAERRAIVVCALGFTLSCEWLHPRESDDFWLTVYESTAVSARRPPSLAQADSRLQALARGLPSGVDVQPVRCDRRRSD